METKRVPRTYHDTLLIVRATGCHFTGPIVLRHSLSTALPDLYSHCLFSLTASILLFAFSDVNRPTCILPPYFLRFSDDFLRNLTKIFSGQCAMQKGFHLIPGRNRRNTAPLSDAQACHCISRYRTVFQLIPGHLLQLLLIGKETA